MTSGYVAPQKDNYPTQRSLATCYIASCRLSRLWLVGTNRHQSLAKMNFTSRSHYSASVY